MKPKFCTANLHWINNGAPSCACRALESATSVPAVATPSDGGKADPSRIENEKEKLGGEASARPSPPQPIPLTAEQHRIIRELGSDNGNFWGSPVQTEEVLYRFARRLLAANDSAAVQREVEELRGWKESALQSLSNWHALGDALLKIYPLRLGVDIPTGLLAAITPPSPDLQKDEEFSALGTPDVSSPAGSSRTQRGDSNNG